MITSPVYKNRTRYRLIEKTTTNVESINVAGLVAARLQLTKTIQCVNGAAGWHFHFARQSSEEALPDPTAKKRRGMSAAARKAQSERMKARWAKRRKRAR
jgi:hypothetical protein